MQDWFKINNEDTVLSPAILFYPERIQYNINLMLEIAGTPERLRPHVKTYKCEEIVKLQLDRGIGKFKCAIISEAAMLAKAGARDILVAYPLTGPAQETFLALTREFPSSKFSVLIDHPDHIVQWEHHGQSVHCYIDLDVGMHRTGIELKSAHSLYDRIMGSSLLFEGWHIYDGHIHHTNLETRAQAVDEAYLGIDRLITATGTESRELICGSSGTFHIHAKYSNRTLSPGTTLLWDHGYQSKFPDLGFELAATLLTRVVSKPDNDRLCLDLGYKAIAAEMDLSPAYFPQIPDAHLLIHSEEHLVIETSEAHHWHIGDCIYALPWHICPTVALHEYAQVVNDNLANDQWEISARNRTYHI